MKYFLPYTLSAAILGLATYPYLMVNILLAIPALIFCLTANDLFWREIKAMNEAAKKHDNDNKIRRANYLEAMSHVQEID